MAWLLIVATLIAVVAIASAVIAWAHVMRDGIRLLDRTIGTRSDEGSRSPMRDEGERSGDPGAFNEKGELRSVEEYRKLLDS